jgi:hypothetical protein
VQSSKVGKVKSAVFNLDNEKGEIGLLLKRSNQADLSAQHSKKESKLKEKLRGTFCSVLQVTFHR